MSGGRGPSGFRSFGCLHCARCAWIMRSLPGGQRTTRESISLSGLLSAPGVSYTRRFLFARSLGSLKFSVVPADKRDMMQERCANDTSCASYPSLGEPAKLSRSNPGPACYACEERRVAEEIELAAKNKRWARRNLAETMSKADTWKAPARYYRRREPAPGPSSISSPRY